MAVQQYQMDNKKLSCSVCLDLLKDPVTVPCGHNYCMNCIESHWDEEDQRETYSCPQCRQTFRPRPALVKNTMLADLVEELKTSGLQAAPADLCHAGPGDVVCDFCTGRKMKAMKSCLQCLVSYCEQHLQPHYESPAFEKHKLINPTEKLRENICPHHGKVMKIFCRTDQKCICLVCAMYDHKGHDTAPASAERRKQQGELALSREKIQQRIQKREKDMEALQQEVEEIDLCAEKAVKDTEKIFAQLLRFLRNTSSDVKQRIRLKQKNELSRIKELREKLQQEISGMKRRDAELEELSRTEDHTTFLQSLSSLSSLSEPTNPASIDIPSMSYFDDVMVTVSKVRDKLQDALTEVLTKISPVETEVLPPHWEPKTKADFLQYSQQITLDPNTAHTRLCLSEGNRKATVVEEKQPYTNHPDRFTDMFQVLSRQDLNGRHYWEVERNWFEVSIAVSHNDISRTGYKSGFGNDDRSWALECFKKQYEFRHNSSSISISGPPSSRIGVYLDHRAGILAFYGVSDTMTLLHRVQTTFSQPLRQGLGVFASGPGSAAEVCKLDQTSI
ncbi:E3 ubiquitin/ISG15 ligase TRIM25-like [Pholidichthys leucotaenia]